jgi:Domain of unknown function (DUF4874)
MNTLHPRPANRLTVGNHALRRVVLPLLLAGATLLGACGGGRGENKLGAGQSANSANNATAGTRVVVDRIAVERMAAERVAAERVAAERVAAESVAAERMAPTSANLTPISYQRSAENFPNPERGLPLVYDVPWPAQVTWGFCGQVSGGIDNFRDYNYTAWNEALNEAVLRSSRSTGTSLVMHRYHIADFRNRPLSDAYLQHLQRDFDAVRNAGLKMVPRFAYNYPMGGPDAPLDRVLGHFDQLKPVFERNKDVIAFVEMGMIGCWGEMHTTAYNLMDISRGYRRLNNATLAIINKAFASVPVERMVAVRYPEYKFQYFNGLQEDAVRENEPTSPITTDQGFDGSIRSRWAQFDDCIVCGEWNAGTYLNPASRANGGAMKVRNFLAQDNRYVVQGG